MDFLGQLFHRGRNITDIFTFHRAKAVKWQDRTLKKMLYKARETEFGQKYQFDEILIAHDTDRAFQKWVPISNYSKMNPWWVREFNGEGNITWPGRAEYFALSSGTSEGSSKSIPVTSDQLKAIVRASRRQLFAVVKTDVPKDFFAKHHLMISGSTDLNYNGTSYSGDLSGITTGNVPHWIDRFALPGDEIRKIHDWELKIEAMVNAAPDWDVVTVSGGPAWIRVLFERIVEKYQLNSIHDIWPNFSAILWGAVSISPYKKQLEAMMGKPVKYFESYLCSEGFIAFQTHESSEGMRLVFRNKTYFEFVPFNGQNFDENGDIKEGAVAIGLEDVNEKDEYAILISTSSGAWRYLVGDTIKFTNLDACEIKITGRTKHFLSICGEHLSVDNMNEGLARTADGLNVLFPEYTVKGIKENGIYGHHWYIAYSGIKPDSDQVKSLLDNNLGILNDDYKIERTHVLKELKITLLPESVFMGWMEKQGKMGGQSKFPRVMPDGLYANWCSYLEKN